MKSIELFDYLNIPYQSEGHKHCRPGWLNMVCPHCVSASGHEGLHLGFDLDGEYFRCWRCGWHPTLDTLNKLTGKPFSQLKEIIRQFGGSSRIKATRPVDVRMKAFTFPSCTSETIHPFHASYLRGRKFDPDKIQAEWGIMSCGPMSYIGKIEYTNRILIPFMWEGKIVTFQARAISKKEPKYRACPKDRELIHHKHILYGNMEEWRDTGICVEGVTDVWRFGPRAFAVLGIEFKLQQVKEMSKRFKKIVVCFDDDPQAIRQADKLVGLLREQKVKARRELIVGDPGGMNQDDANHFVKEILK